MSEEELRRLQTFLPLMAQAVKFAEGNPRNFGVLSVPTTNPGKVLTNTVNNNFNRWVGGKTPAPWIDERPEKFVDFMRRRWAPLQSEGATNDPKNLNKNWAPNVRWYMENKLSPQDYEFLKRLNFVKQMESNGHRTSKSNTV